ARLLTEALQRDDVPYLLGRAQALGLPILPLDERGDLLRFHPLWREMLLRGDSNTLTPEMQKALHRKFGHALEARGDLEDALGHYASAGANAELALALREGAWPLL